MLAHPASIWETVAWSNSLENKVRHASNRDGSVGVVTRLRLHHYIVICRSILEALPFSIRTVANTLGGGLRQRLGAPRPGRWSAAPAAVAGGGVRVDDRGDLAPGPNRPVE